MTTSPSLRRVPGRLKLCSKGDPAGPAEICEWVGEAAVIAILEVGIGLATAGFRGRRASARFEDVTWRRTGSRLDIRLDGKDEIVEFDDSATAAAFDAAIRNHRDSAASAGPLRLGADGYLLKGCAYLGGANIPLSAGQRCDVGFHSSSVDLYDTPASMGDEPQYAFNVSAGTSIDIGGPGLITVDGGWVGGGMGLMGAARGAAIASAMNRLTTRSSITTLITITDSRAEAFLVSSTITPEQLRRATSDVHVAIRAARSATAANKNPVSDTDIAGSLERLAVLHRAGSISYEEFVIAKSRLLGDGRF